MEGFEPPTSCTQSKRATKLRYIPKPFTSLPLLSTYTFALTDSTSQQTPTEG